MPGTIGYRYDSPSDEFSYVWYRFGGKSARSFFSPMHAVDQLLRPELWQNELVSLD
jgi:hypothetical protein